jgi:hypothetical protein
VGNARVCGKDVLLELVAHAHSSTAAVLQSWSSSWAVAIAEHLLCREAKTRFIFVHMSCSFPIQSCVVQGM